MADMLAKILASILDGCALYSKVSFLPPSLTYIKGIKFISGVCMPCQRHAVSNLRNHSKRMDIQWIAFLSGQNCDESFRPGTWAHKLLQMSVKSLQKIADMNNLPTEALAPAISQFCSKAINPFVNSKLNMLTTVNQIMISSTVERVD
ncbi:hypothetical protein PAAG_12047 [Paracoccidioides lutzii Pb01]|uniref:Uncharacterized protein n=1 Tax=Paracoccidioides lutzii (strain ATCC MYA-826 / Pb01) TaxID=502779 RepID=A0A0A2V0F6_PARBA|nr:hypothetical protein PAAG_12047 [Paracoccidioides lutzii Pb01]KGQ01276.1 hypothetical protein PAAG_12047 [Paracoccidioides lutzii Pb01]